MDETKFVTVGMLIEMDGAQFECTRDITPKFEFQNLKNGLTVTIEMIDLFEGIAKQTIRVLSGKVTPHAVDIHQKTDDEISLITLSEKNQRDLDIRMTFVLGILRRKITRGQLELLREAADEIRREINALRKKDEPETKSPSPQTLNRWLSRFEKSCRDVFAVLSKNVFRRRAVLVSEKSEALLAESLDAKLMTDGCGRMSEIYEDYERRVEAFNREEIAAGREPIEAASRSTLVRRFYAIPSFERDAAIHGIQAARVNHRVAKGHLPSSFALEFVEVDHGQLDLYVIDDLLFIPLGIPWITILRDRHTGIVLGFYISFRQTSLQSIFGAIRHSIMPHNRIAELWPDIHSPWPAGFAFCYVSDRGADFLSPRYRLALRQMGSDALYCEARTPWHKGPIERYIGQTNRELIETLPGKVFPFRKAPYGYDARNQAVVRFSTLVYLVHKWIAEIYHHRPHSRKLACPLERWDKSISEMPIPIPPSPESLIVLTGEMYERTISQEAIVHDWLNYGSPRLEDICKDRGRVKIPFVSNPENLGFGMAIDPRTNSQFRVDCMSPDYANGLSRAQHQYIRRNIKIQLTRDNAVSEFMRTQREIQESLAEEILSKDNADKVRLHKVAIRAGIDSKAVLDGKPRSVADIIKLSKETAASASKEPDVPAVHSFTDVPLFSYL